MSQPPPPGSNFVADGLPGSIPNQVIEQVMKETLDWDVKVARVNVRNKGKEATKRAFQKCTGRPAADTIEVRGKMVVLRAQAEKEKEADQQQEGFFAGLKKEEAARAVLKEKEPTQSMRDFAFRALSVDKQGPVWNSFQDDDEEMGGRKWKQQRAERDTTSNRLSQISRTKIENRAGCKESQTRRRNERNEAET